MEYVPGSVVEEAVAVTTEVSDTFAASVPPAAEPIAPKAFCKDPKADWRPVSACCWF